MPSSTLNWILSDQQSTFEGAWQRRIGLPEGAPLKSRLNILACLSETIRSFTFDEVTFALTRQRARVLPRPAPYSDSDVLASSSCGDLEDGVPHAEALSPADIGFIVDPQSLSDGGPAQLASSFSALASPDKTSPN